MQWCKTWTLFCKILHSKLWFNFLWKYFEDYCKPALRKMLTQKGCMIFATYIPTSVRNSWSHEKPFFSGDKWISNKICWQWGQHLFMMATMGRILLKYLNLHWKLHRFHTIIILYFHNFAFLYKEQFPVRALHFHN